MPAAFPPTVIARAEQAAPQDCGREAPPLLYLREVAWGKYFSLLRLRTRRDTGYSDTPRTNTRVA